MQCTSRVWRLLGTQRACFDCCRFGAEHSLSLMSLLVLHCCTIIPGCHVHYAVRGGGAPYVLALMINNNNNSMDTRSSKVLCDAGLAC